jgi:hypothetical protein
VCFRGGFIYINRRVLRLARRRPFLGAETGCTEVWRDEVQPAAVTEVSRDFIPAYAGTVL